MLLSIQIKRAIEMLQQLDIMTHALSDGHYVDPVAIEEVFAEQLLYRDCLDVLLRNVEPEASSFRLLWTVMM
jgi:hypothetical protein